MFCMYRVFHQLADLGWVDLDNEMFHHLAQLLSQFSQNPIFLSRIGQTVELPRANSNQPKFAS